MLANNLNVSVLQPTIIAARGRPHCRRMVTERYCKANGYEADSQVVYGDTDSVMVDFRVPDNARAMELGREAAAHVSATFTPPIKLEFEKVRSIGLQQLHPLRCSARKDYNRVNNHCS